jgi:Fe-S-cluster-containing hydrogenase component 2
MERLEKREEPACLASCPMYALEFVEAEQYVREKRMDAAEEIALSTQKNNRKEEQKENIQ